jgi:hypothetical protein
MRPANVRLLADQHLDGSKMRVSRAGTKSPRGYISRKLSQEYGGDDIVPSRPEEHSHAPVGAWDLVDTSCLVHDHNLSEHRGYLATLDAPRTEIVSSPPARP